MEREPVAIRPAVVVTTDRVYSAGRHRNSRDLGLDLLLLRFHLETGARREGALNLTLGRLDAGRSTVWLLEKFGAEREQPVSPSLLHAVMSHAGDRGAFAAEGPVFRTASGRPASRRRYNTLFDNIRGALDWAAHTPVTAHVLRHTAITQVERSAGYAVASAFAGHAPGSVTGTYVKASVGEVAAAVAILTGEHHPLSVDAKIHRAAVPAPR